MSEPRRGRGRRDNGLDAALWTPLRDVDPRVGEHLLDMLREAGIAAYLEPSADVSPYTRTVYLPSPPSDRLFVDRARRTEARGLVDRNADEHARRRRQSRPLRRDLDEEAEWRRIVAALEAEPGLTGADADPAPAPAPAVSLPLEPEVPEADHLEPDLIELPEEHYEPPPPPPLRPPAPASLYAVLLIAAGALLIFAPQVVGLSGNTALVLGVVGVAAGVAVLVSRMRERSVDDGDDGAVV
jgi:hypothetical protein